MAFPVALTTGYTTVPLQGTNLVETTGRLGITTMILKNNIDQNHLPARI
jgi:hypothetical protein